MIEAPRIKAIYISPSKGEPMTSVSEVNVVMEKGLESDRYAVGSGAWSKVRVGETVRDVTFIAADALKDTPFTEEDTRRNVVLEDIPPEVLLAYVGQYFEVGGVLFQGVEDCAPCDRPSTLSGKPNFKEIMDQKAGIRARAVTGGSLAVGDTMTHIFE